MSRYDRLLSRRVWMLRFSAWFNTRITAALHTNGDKIITEMKKNGSY